MYAKYVWLNGATQAQMLDDICKLIAGTPIANLSASCDKVNSQLIANDIPTNWTVHDSAAAVGAQVVRSANAVGSKFKYGHLSYSGSVLTLKSYEDWNSSTHVGTNPAHYSNTGISSFNVHSAFSTTGGSIWVYATNRNLIISNGATGGASGVLEFSPDSNAINDTYPLHVLANFTSNYSALGAASGTTDNGLCRFKRYDAAGDAYYNSGYTNSNVRAIVQTLGAGANTYGMGAIGASAIRNTFETISISAFPLIVVGAYVGVLGRCYEVNAIAGTSCSANSLDEITVDGQQYIILKLAASVDYVIFPKA